MTRQHIVVLDGYTLNPGDLSWSELESLGTCAIHDRTAPDQVIARSGQADAVLTNKTPVTRDHLQSLPRLRYIGVLATGYNIVDTAAARERGVAVTNVPTYGTNSVAQHTFALLLELTQRAGHHSETVRQGRWNVSPDFCYWDYPLIELEGLTLGIVGLGRIGRQVARLALAFGMRVVAHAHRSAPAFDGVEFVGMDDLFRRSDVVSLHCPLTSETRGLVNAARLALMKPTAFLLNTSRGPLIDEPALSDALNTGRIAGAALDVLSVEPPVNGNPLIAAKHCLITPHIAWATRSARARLMKVAVDNLKSFLEGRLVNGVS